MLTPQINMEKNKLLKINPLVQTMVLRRLGIYCSERLAINDFELMKCVSLLIEEVGEEWLDEQYKKRNKKWEDIKEDLEILKKKLFKAKTFYDCLADKSFKKLNKQETIESAILTYFKKTASKISLLQPVLYELFVMIIKNSDIQRSKIPSDSFKILEHMGMRKMLMPKKPTSNVNTDNIVKND